MTGATSYLQANDEKEKSMPSRVVARGNDDFARCGGTVVRAPASKSDEFDTELIIMTCEALEELKRGRDKGGEKSERTQRCSVLGNHCRKEKDSSSAEKEGALYVIGNTKVHSRLGRRSKSIEQPQCADLNQTSARMSLVNTSRRRSKSIDNPLGSGRGLKVDEINCFGFIPDEHVHEETAPLSSPSSERLKETLIKGMGETKARMIRSRSHDDDDGSPRRSLEGHRLSRSIDIPSGRASSGRSLSLDTFSDFFDASESSRSTMSITDALLNGDTTSDDGDSFDGKIAPDLAYSLNRKASIVAKAFSFRLARTRTSFQRLDDDYRDVARGPNTQTKERFAPQQAPLLLDEKLLLDDANSAPSAALSRVTPRSSKKKLPPKRSFSLDVSAAMRRAAQSGKERSSFSPLHAHGENADWNDNRVPVSTPQERFDIYKTAMELKAETQRMDPSPMIRNTTKRIKGVKNGGQAGRVSCLQLSATGDAIITEIDQTKFN